MTSSATIALLLLAATALITVASARTVSTPPNGDEPENGKWSIGRESVASIDQSHTNENTRLRRMHLSNLADQSPLPFVAEHMHPTMLHARPTTDRKKRASMPPIRFAAPDMERDGDYWLNVGQETLQQQLHKNQLNQHMARNIILFLGDGMSLPTLTATRVYMGGEEKSLPFERFPYVGLSKTYCANTQVADSACTATAYLGGVKGNYATIGLTAAVALNDCRGENNTAYHVESIAKWAQDSGMATGLVTTTSVTHASPAGVYAHTANRNFENNQALINEGGDPSLCTDIATQLVDGDVGRNLRVVMGGGRREFMRTDETDSDGKPGLRTDGMDLIQRWKDQQAALGRRAVYAQTKNELMNVSVCGEIGC